MREWMDGIFQSGRSEVRYWEEVITQKQSYEFKNEIKKFEDKKLFKNMYHWKYKTDRRCMHFGNDALEYSFAGNSYRARPWSPELRKLTDSQRSNRKGVQLLFNNYL